MEDRIDDYVQGKMSIADRTAFEQLMAGDVELTKMVENYSAMEGIGEGALEMELLQEVEQVGAGGRGDTVQRGKRGVGFRGMNKFIWIGLLFLVAASLIGYWYIDQQKEVKRDSIFANSYERPSDEDVQRSGVNLDDLNSVEKAKYYFSLNDWDNSEKQWENVLTESTDSETLSTAHYYLGHIYLNRYEFEKARMAFAKSKRPEVEQYMKLIEKLEGI